MSLFIVMVPLLKLLLIYAHGWVQKLVPVYFYSSMTFINTLLFYQLLVSFTLPVPTTNVHRRQWGGGGGGGGGVLSQMYWGGVE